MAFSAINFKIPQNAAIATAAETVPVKVSHTVTFPEANGIAPQPKSEANIKQNLGAVKWGRKLACNLNPNKKSFRIRIGTVLFALDISRWKEYNEIYMRVELSGINGDLLPLHIQYYLLDGNSKVIDRVVSHTFKNASEMVTSKLEFAFKTEIRTFILRFSETNDEMVDAALSPSSKVICEDRNDKGLANLLKTGRFSDVIISAGGRDIPAHKAILSTRSSVFAQLFDESVNTQKRIEINNVDHDVLMEMLHFIYTGETRNLEDMADKMLPLADRYDLAYLKSQCEQILLETIDDDNACEYLIIGDLYNSNDLKSGAEKYIVANFLSVKGSEAFQNMATTHLHLLLHILKTYNGEESAELEPSIV